MGTFNNTRAGERQAHHHHPHQVVRLSQAACVTYTFDSGDITLRKAYLRMFVGQVVVSDTEIH